MSEPQPASQPPVIGAQPPLAAGASPSEPSCSPSFGRQFLAVLLSLCLGLFLADAVVSLLDDSLRLIVDVHLLTAVRGMLGLFTMLLALVVYGLMALTPAIPKRLFIPVTLFNPLAMFAAIPLMIFYYAKMQQIAWAISAGQLVLGLWVLFRIRGGFKFGWPLVSASQLQDFRFRWRNLFVFLLVNVFGLLPAAVVYLVLCASVAVDHFSDGFVALRTGGVTVQVRNYVRNDGKMIRLFPMAHVGDAAFYRSLSQSFQPNSIILLEGVTDNRNLLTNKLSYKRMAKSLGLAEQQKEFRPTRGELVYADVDVEEFATNTIDFINLIMLIHSKGVNPETVSRLLTYSPPPRVEQQLLNDLLRLRNRHLLKEIRSRLLDSEIIIVPWGAVHMPEIAREIQKSGFRLNETKEYTVVKFRSAGNKSKAERKAEGSEKP